MAEADNASSTSAQDSFVHRQLEEFRNSYEKTGNPCFAWHAINYCNPAYWGHETEIPTWCRAPLFDAASKLVALFDQMELPAGGTPKARRQKRKRLWGQIPAALGLSSKGKNQPQNAAAALRTIRTAKEYKFVRAAGKLTAKQALGAAKRVAGRAPSGNTLTDDPDAGEDRAIFAKIAKGVRLSTGGNAPPRRRSDKGKVIKPPP